MRNRVRILMNRLSDPWTRPPTGGSSLVVCFLLWELSRGQFNVLFRPGWGHHLPTLRLVDFVSGGPQEGFVLHVIHRSCDGVLATGVVVPQNSTSPNFAPRKIQTHQKIRNLTLVIMGPSKVDSAYKKAVFGKLRKPQNLNIYLFWNPIY